MRKHCKRKVRIAAPPSMCMMVAKNDYATMHYIAIESLIGGWSEPTHIEHLLDTAKTLIFLGTDKKNSNAIAAGRATLEVVRSAVERFKKAGKYGINGDELKKLRKFAAFADEYIPRQSGAAVMRAEANVSTIKQMAFEDARREYDTQKNTTANGRERRAES